MKLFTIGFTQKTAQEFFDILRDNGVRRIIDIRINPSGQLSGFAKQADLPYFLTQLADSCDYKYMPELAPTKELLKQYRNDSDWEIYETQFTAIMDERNVPEILDFQEFDNTPSCLLCSEATADYCHRRLVAERIAAQWSNVEIVHL